MATAGLLVQGAVILVHSVANSVFCTKVRNGLTKKDQQMLTVNSGVLEFPGVDLVVEQDVDLAERAVLGLRKTEPTPDDAEKVGSCVEETGLSAPVPGKGRKHARGDRIVEDTSQVVYKAAKRDSLVAELTRGCLSNDRIAHWSDGDHVDERGHNKDDANCQMSILGVTKAQTTDGNETEEHEGQPRHVEGGAA